LWHAQIAIDAMEAGKHVYCEKPMTRYLEEAFKVEAAVKRTGRTFQLAHRLHGGGLAQERELIKAGKIGLWSGRRVITAATAWAASGITRLIPRPRRQTLTGRRAGQGA